MLSRLGIEASQAAQYVIAFAIILVLVALFGLVLRRVTGGRLMLPGQDRARARQPRLGIVDIYDLDRQRQLILLRRDNVEHLLLIGGPNDVVIETNIVRVAGARLPVASAEPSAERAEPSFERPPEPAARPPADQSGRPSIEAQLAARLGALVGRPSGDSDQAEELAPIASASAPAPARVEPVLKPDAVTPGFPRADRTEPMMPGRPTQVPPVRPVETPPRPASPPSRPVSVPMPEPRRPEQPRSAPLRPIGPAAPTVPERGPDAAVLSDMAKQLEEALKRPMNPPAAPSPAPAAQEENESPVPPPASVYGPRPRSAPPAPAPSGTSEPPRPAPETARPVSEPMRPVPPPAPPAPPLPAPHRAAPPPPPASPAPSPPPPASAPPPQPARTIDDPFSVEEIEAEFARLLGRPIDKSDKT